MASVAGYQVIQQIAIRQQRENDYQQNLAKWDKSGRVVGFSQGRAIVKTGLGNIVYAPQQNILTNGNIVGQTVAINRPNLGAAFIKAPVKT